MLIITLQAFCYLLLTMIYNEFYYIICVIYGKKQLVMYIGSAIGISFFSSNEYQISENDIGTPLIHLAMYARM